MREESMENQNTYTKEEIYDIIYSKHPNYKGFVFKNEDYSNLCYFKLDKEESHKLVLYWQQTKDKFVYDVLFENYLIVYKKALGTYTCVSHTLKRKDGSYELDLLQDYVFVLNKVINSYKTVDNYSFNSYSDMEFKYYISELIRNKYFSLLKIPQKKNRIRENRPNKIELDDNIEDLINCVESDIMDRIMDDNIVKEVEKYISNKSISKRDYEMFLKYLGLYGTSKEYKLKDLAEEYNLSISTISKSIKKIKEKLKQNKYLQELFKNI